MSLIDSVLLGKLADDIDGEDTQEEVNEESLFLYNQNDLLKSISEKISRYELVYLLNQVKISYNEYWLDVLKEIINVYDLNSLKHYLTDNIDIPNFNMEIKRLLLFLKLKINYKSFKGMSTYEKYIAENRQVIEKKLMEFNPPLLMKLAIDYIDNESLGRFLSKIAEISYMNERD